MTTMHLVGHGAVGWDEVRRLAEDCRAAWADYDGFHVGELPAVVPPYSHVWAWSAQRWLRIRPDGDGGAIVGELGLPGDGGGSPPGDVVAVRLVRGRLWDPSGSAGQRVTPRGDDLAGAEFHLIEVQGATAVTFVHEGPLPEGLG